MIIRRRGLEEEQSAPTPTYEIHTVTTACTKAPAVQTYFRGLVSSGVKGFFWIRKGASSIPNNHIIHFVCGPSTSYGATRWRSGNIASLAIGPSYDAIISVGDEFLVVDFTYGSEIYCPSNMGVSVSSSTASATITSSQELQSILPDRPNIVLVKNIESSQYTFAFAIKGLTTIRMTGTTSVSNEGSSSTNTVNLAQGTPLWVVKYN